jgi:tetratricopeptide (TPR) repeat protein
MAILAGDGLTALGLLEEAEAFFRQAGDRLHLTEALESVAIADRLLARHELARKAYTGALRLSTESRNLPGIGSGLLIGSAVESAAGGHDAAVGMLAAAITLRDTFGASAPEMPGLVAEVEAGARRVIGDEAVEEALAGGRRMTLEEVIEFATTLAR